MKMVLLCTSDRMVEPSLIYIYINITKIYKIYILYTRGTHTSLIYRHRGYILKILVILLRDFYRLVIPRVKQRTKTYKKLLYSCYILVIFCDEDKMR